MQKKERDEGTKGRNALLGLTAVVEISTGEYRAIETHKFNGERRKVISLKLV